MVTLPMGRRWWAELIVMYDDLEIEKSNKMCATGNELSTIEQKDHRKNKLRGTKQNPYNLLAGRSNIF